MRNKFKPYTVTTGDYSLEEASTHTLSSFRENWICGDISNHFGYYEDLISNLASMQHLEVRSVYRFMEPLADKTVVSLRHDVDIDYKLSLDCARTLARYGVPGSFYYLHTAYYWGQWSANHFLRNPNIAHLLKDVAVTGCEIGLHIDPIHLYLNGFNGAESVVKELEFIRGLGIQVHGVATHNSAPVYGADNFEIFKGYSFGGRSNFMAKNIQIPLQTLDMASLNLTYEANFPLIRPAFSREAQDYISYCLPSAAINNKQWMYQYLHNNPCYARAHEVICWVHGPNNWVWSDIRTNTFGWKLHFSDIIYKLNELINQPPCRVLFILHPCFFNKSDFEHSDFQLRQRLESIENRQTLVELRMQDNQLLIDKLRNIKHNYFHNRLLSALRRSLSSLRNLLKTR